ncbi:MAG: hypothetical protein CM1200mP29_02870 [Verrucomicrobiota bacterium]|nr:MAG: hypothetical protein CM1200mP29_02870 [Verrucomicrobiota bacterium]
MSTNQMSTKMIKIGSRFTMNAESRVLFSRGLGNPGAFDKELFPALD